MQRRVFISHSSIDAETACILCSKLEERGIEVWIAPRDIQPGAEWADAIVRGIESCDVFLLLLSKHSSESKQVIREIECAAGKGRTLIPVRLEDLTLSGALKYFLGVCHWFDAVEPPLEARFGELAERIDHILADGSEPVSFTPMPTWKRPAKARSRLLLSPLLALTLVSAGALVAISMTRGRSGTEESARLSPSSRSEPSTESAPLPQALEVAQTAPLGESDILRLRETHPNPDSQYVIIEDLRTKAQDVFSIGESIFDQGTLTKIEWDNVEIDQHGSKRRLRISKE